MQYIKRRDTSYRTRGFAQVVVLGLILQEQRVQTPAARLLDGTVAPGVQCTSMAIKTKLFIEPGWLKRNSFWLINRSRNCARLPAKSK